MRSDLDKFKKETKAETNYLLQTKQYLYNENNSTLQELPIYIL